LAAGEAAAFMLALAMRILRSPAWSGCNIELLPEPWIALVLDLEHAGSSSSETVPPDAGATF
jgi:hypothetical protein